MGRLGSTLFRMLYRCGGGVAVVATLTGVLAGIDVAPPSVTLLSARHVRSIDTAELGIPSPRGISYLPDSGALLVHGQGATELRITTGGDRLEPPEGAARPAQPGGMTKPRLVSYACALQLSNSTTIRAPAPAAKCLSKLGSSSWQASVCPAILGQAIHSMRSSMR